MEVTTWDIYMIIQTKPNTTPLIKKDRLIFHVILPSHNKYIFIRITVDVVNTLNLIAEFLIYKNTTIWVFLVWKETGIQPMNAEIFWIFSDPML